MKPSVSAPADCHACRHAAHWPLRCACECLEPDPFVAETHTFHSGMGTPVNMRRDTGDPRCPVCRGSGRWEGEECPCVRFGLPPSQKQLRETNETGHAYGCECRECMAEYQRRLK